MKGFAQMPAHFPNSSPPVRADCMRAELQPARSGFRFSSKSLATSRTDSLSLSPYKMYKGGKKGGRGQIKKKVAKIWVVDKIMKENQKKRQIQRSFLGSVG